MRSTTRLGGFAVELLKFAMTRSSSERTGDWLRPVDDEEDEAFLSGPEDAEAKGCLDDGNRSTLNLVPEVLPVYMTIHR